MLIYLLGVVLTTFTVPGHFTERHFTERQFPKRTFCRRILCRTNILSNGQYDERAVWVTTPKITLFPASCRFGKMSFRQKVRSSKCPFVKMSVRQNVRSAKCLSAKCLSAKCPATTLTILVGVLNYMLYNTLGLFLNNYVSNSSTA